MEGVSASLELADTVAVTSFQTVLFAGDFLECSG
jgi:hypothetical protein